MLFILATTLAAGRGGGGGGGGGSFGPDKLVSNAGTPPSGPMGVAYAGYTFALASGGTAPFIYSKIGVLPPSMSLSATRKLNGTPRNAAIYPFAIVVTDFANPAITRTQPFSLKSAWSPSNGDSPPGLTLASDGSLSGTPTSAGTYTFIDAIGERNQPFPMAKGRRRNS